MEIAPELNISVRTLDRTIAGERMPREWELGRLAEILLVPRWFLERGLQPEDQAPGEELIDEERDEIARLRSELEAEVARLRRANDQLEERLSTPAPSQRREQQAG